MAGPSCSIALRGKLNRGLQQGAARRFQAQVAEPVDHIMQCTLVEADENLVVRFANENAAYGGTLLIEVF